MQSVLSRGFYKKTKFLQKPGAAEGFANGSSSVYFDQMYEKWRRDPNSVHASFQAYFQNVEKGVESPYAAPPTLG